MKRRVARLLEVEDVKPEEIIAVTFTRVAAEDLHRELAGLGVPGADELNGRTLHSLAMSILMRQHVLQVLGRTPRPLNEFELQPLLCDLSNAHGNKRERRRLIQAYGAAWARLQMQDPGYARTPAEQAFQDDLVAWLILHEAMLIDEIIPHLFQYLRGNPGAPERREFSHMLIDEYQDLNRAEQEVLHFLGENAAVCVIGDDDQSIYSFKHAHPEGIRQWAVNHAAENHIFEECRRCPTTVVRMANALIVRNADRVPGRRMTECERNGPGEVSIRQFSTAEAEAAAVATKITHLIQQGVSPGDIIVLAQRATFATPIYRHLRDEQIPVKSYYSETELDTTEAQERFAMLKLLRNNEDRVALRWLLGCNHNSWHARQYARVIEYIRRHGGTPWQVLSLVAMDVIEIPHTRQLISRFEEIKAEVEQLGAIADLDEFVRAWLPDDPHTDLLSDTVARACEQSQTVEEMYEALYAAITQPEIPLEVAEVRVMSLHKSKGLSSPYVFVVGCVEGLLPSQPPADMPADERDAKLQEDRRLFYVGITRVKAAPPEKPGYLAITFPQSMALAAALSSQITPVRTAGGIAVLQPSRFIQEMAPHAPAAAFNMPL